MISRKKSSRRVGAWRAAAIAVVALIAAGCASTAKTTATTTASPAATRASSSGMDMATSSASPTASSSMNMAGMSAGGITPVPTQVLGTATWQGMKITAKAMTAVPFLIYNGTKMQEVKPPKNASFHLMVFLSDAQTGVVIPYASVWGTITQGSKTPFNETLWPMISRYMGPHYGNDVSLPSDGTYKLSLLVSPPVSARHLEYQNVWLKPHRVTFTFHWTQPA
jgi:hypothetical protein